MLRPLAKKDRDGTPYSRPSAVERAIESVIQEDCSALRRRVLERNPESPEFLSSECLVFLLREARRRGDEETMYILLPPLLARCEAILASKIPDHRLANAAEIRENILGNFSDLFAEDGTGHDPNDLDFFECRFNLAFRTFWITHLRAELSRLKHSPQLVTLKAAADDFDPSADDDVLARVSPAFRVPPSQLNDLLRSRLRQAIDFLPSEERKAVALCYILGLKVESDDPTEKTAATLCGVTGRTIRNRLQRAAAKLARFVEEMQQ